MLSSTIFNFALSGHSSYYYWKKTTNLKVWISLIAPPQMYPGWSARDNYAVHKKRRKRKTKSVDGNKQSPTATSTGGTSTTEDQDSHNTSNDNNNDVDGKIYAQLCKLLYGSCNNVDCLSKHGIGSPYIDCGR